MENKPNISGASTLITLITTIRITTTTIAPNIIDKIVKRHLPGITLCNILHINYDNNIYITYSEEKLYIYIYIYIYIVYINPSLYYLD